MHTPEHTIGWLALIGALVGLGKLLYSPEKLTLRVVLGRAIVCGGLGAASAVVLIWFPNAPLAALTGLAAFLGSLGTDGLLQLAKNLKR